MKVQLDHLAPSAVGHRVVAEAVVEKVNGRRVLFTVSVNDERGLVAVGRVTRVVVDAEGFVAKASGALSRRLDRARQAVPSSGAEQAPEARGATEVGDLVGRRRGRS